MSGLRRHSLVRLARPPGSDIEDDARRAIAWQAAGRPFVVARRGDDAAMLRLGFCTVDPRHPDLRPRRVAVRSAAGDVLAVDRPPSLALVTAQAAAHPRHAALVRLQEAARAEDIELRVYGSWMWQVLTGEPHVHALSDLDLLVDVADRAGADRAADFLSRQEAATGLTLDGELHLSGVGDLSWREWRQGAAEVLVKTLDSLRLVPRNAVGA